MTIQTKNYSFVRNKLLNKEEIAFLDVREEDPHAQEHPLFAANLPFSRVEIDAYAKLPKKTTPIVTLDDGEGFAQLAAQRFINLGYTDVSVFDGGVQGWKSAGGEVFKDVNVPSKSFGEFVESKRHTPSLSAQEVKQLIDNKEDVVVVDVRRFDEYNTMSIPTGISVPGAELVLRLPELAPNPKTKVIVNCAGRTRSIIGTQSLINAGIPNEVNALRNGTIGWTLAGQELDKGQSRKFQEVSDDTRNEAAVRARSVADRAGVKRASLSDVQTWKAQSDRTTYFFDTRTPDEYEAGHLPGFRSVPGGQLVQETEMVAPVRGARVVLVDPSGGGVRANMPASWLAQMAWDIYVLDGVNVSDLTEKGVWKTPLPNLPTIESVDAVTASNWLKSDSNTIAIDFSTHANYVKGHIPGSWYALRSQLAEAMKKIPQVDRYVITSSPAELSLFAAQEVQALTEAEVLVLEGGNAAWIKAGLDQEKGPSHLASPPLDRYKRPYEGTSVDPAAMQAYLDWEFGLVEQLGKDGTHHFWVL
ncbi:rhodanese homology domain-containing protein [Polynucleobacter sp. AP-Reno-20A-A9]|uniref:rhodanese homology domain-containing protein n=1 Tax=Polynucleobacter sp. AP-Reno-20A-A9 TaxID=2576925 RepID=UPI001C0DE2F5|nr:rhodanese homology domain-containing protein [Polynucleobacter sp. AP-Reno-20A-A9]MBU3628050.1 rhodanese-related sulfurtransferase [Polynucleobacter sp. AP-Reno-20A-A9]